MHSFKNFISAEALNKQLGEKQDTLKVLDCSYSFGGKSGPAYLNFQAAHIPTAQWFDIDDVADISAPFLHTFPSKQTFEQKISALGIKNTDHVVVYDQNGFYMAAARVWWMFKAFGHENISVLNGGFPAWIGHPLEKGIGAEYPVSSYQAQDPTHKIRSAHEVLAAIDNESLSILDCRDTARFTMSHIPTSQNVFFGKFLNADGTIKSKEELKAVVETLNLDKTQEQICSCGSGVTACVGLLVLDELGFDKLSLFDGSWTEWSSNDAYPQASGM